jgi:hypothetical protein
VSTDPARLPELVATGLAMAQTRLAATGSGIHRSIHAQLLRIEQALVSGFALDDATLDALTLGVYAAREFETSDREYADLLFDVEYLVKRL